MGRDREVRLQPTRELLHDNGHGRRTKDVLNAIQTTASFNWKPRLGTCDDGSECDQVQPPTLPSTRISNLFPCHCHLTLAHGPAD